MALRGPSLSPIGNGARQVVARATHGVKRSEKPHIIRITIVIMNCRGFMKGAGRGRKVLGINTELF